MATAYLPEEDNRVLDPGDEITSFRGEVWVFQKVTRLPEPGRSGKVEVHRGGLTMEFYHTVFPGLELRE